VGCKRAREYGVSDDDSLDGADMSRSTRTGVSKHARDARLRRNSQRYGVDAEQQSKRHRGSGRSGKAPHDGDTSSSTSGGYDDLRDILSEEKLDAEYVGDGAEDVDMGTLIGSCNDPLILSALKADQVLEYVSDRFVVRKLGVASQGGGAPNASIAAADQAYHGESQSTVVKVEAEDAASPPAEQSTVSTGSTGSATQLQAGNAADTSSHHSLSARSNPGNNAPSNGTGLASFPHSDQPTLRLPPAPSKSQRSSFCGKLSAEERSRLEDFISFVQTSRIVVHRGDLSRALRDYINTKRSREFFEKLVSRRNLNHILGGFLAPRLPRKKKAGYGASTSRRNAEEDFHTIPGQNGFPGFGDAQRSQYPVPIVPIPLLAPPFTAGANGVAPTSHMLPLLPAGWTHPLLAGYGFSMIQQSLQAVHVPSSTPIVLPARPRADSSTQVTQIPVPMGLPFSLQLQLASSAPAASLPSLPTGTIPPPAGLAGVASTATLPFLPVGTTAPRGSLTSTTIPSAATLPALPIGPATTQTGLPQ
jgi:hypothetical protein